MSPNSIADSDFNRAHLGAARLVAYRDLDDMLQRCTELLRAPGSKYLYAYWSELDSLGHRHGIWSEAAVRHLLELDRAFGRLLGAVEGTDTLVLVCADHGQIDVPVQDRISMDDHPALSDCLVLPLCGEPRAAYCYLRPGCEDDFDDYVRRELPEAADCLPSASLIDSGWFGLGAPHPRLKERIGDRVLLMKDGYMLKDWLPQERRFDMVGTHGGLSADELWVPFIVATA